MHVADSKNYEAVCAAYARDDNPFFNPETGAAGNAHAWNMFRSIADYKLPRGVLFWDRTCDCRRRFDNSGF